MVGKACYALLDVRVNEQSGLPKSQLQLWGLDFAVGKQCLRHLHQICGHKTKNKIIFCYNCYKNFID